jgi:glutaredoxin
MTVVVYGKSECSLCEKALAVLAHLQREFGYRVDYVDITVDPGLAALYREAIPVVAVDGVEIARGRVTIPALRAALSAVPRQ